MAARRVRSSGLKHNLFRIGHRFDVSAKISRGSSGSFLVVSPRQPRPKMALLKLLSLLTLLFVVYCSASDGATASPAGMTSSGNHAFKPRPRQPLGSAYGVDGSSMSTVYVHNLTYTLSLPRALAFDTVSAVAAVQGIVNRDRPVLYVLYNDIDATWLEYCRRNWLTNASIVQLNTVEV